jgi:hypothetical protein
VVHEWNTAVHVQQAEGDPIKRAFTLDELQAFFVSAVTEFPSSGSLSVT